MNLKETVPALNVVTLNIYNGKYLDEEILPWLERTKPDVFLAQEVFTTHRERIRNALGSHDEYFSPLCPLSVDNGQTAPELWGIALFSRLPLIGPQDHYYKGDRNVFEPNVNNNPADHRSIITAKVELQQQQFIVATTHFTHSYTAEVTPEQAVDFARLNGFLENFPELILGGDFNTPRGYGIFDSLSKRYVDNMPKKLIGTHDDKVRPQATWNNVVDGLFTSEHYRVSTVSITNGLSDHVAIGVWVEKNTNQL